MDGMQSCAVQFRTIKYRPDFDAAAWVIGANIHRRHLSKQQQADLIVAAIEAG